MAGKDTMSEDDDAPDGDDKGGQQQATDKQPPRDGQVLRPVDEVPAIKRGDANGQDKQEFEIVEVGSDGQPIDDRSADHGDRDTGGEGNLSEDQAGERSLLDQRKDTRGKSARESHSERRARQKAARDHERAEAAGLRREVEGLRDELTQFRTGAEKRLNAADLGRVQGDLTRLEQDIARHDASQAAAEKSQREALSNNDADAFMAAQKTRDDAVASKFRAESKRDALKARLDGSRGREDDDTGEDRQDDRGRDRRDGDGRQQQRQPQQVQPLTGHAKRFADDFLRKHDWMDAKSRDPDVRRDSQRVRFLDAEVTAEGYDPHTQEYWDELEDRMREMVPHAFEDDEDEGRTSVRPNGKQRPNGNGRSVNGNGSGNGRAPNGQQTQQRRAAGPPVADVGGRGGNGSKTQVRITPDRKRGMIESGSLNPDGSIANKVKFDRQVREFAAFDAREGAGR